MSPITIQIILYTFFCIFICSEGIKCPDTLPYEIEENCYKFETTPFKLKDAMDNCQKIDENAVLVSIRSKAVLDKIQKIVIDFISSKLDSTSFWIGLLMEDNTMGKALKDRNWKWKYDGTEIIQKDYPFWENGEGPTEDGLTCSTIRASDNFLVTAIDCGGARLPFVCMKTEGEVCKDSGPPNYLMYGNYCLAAGTGGPKGYELDGACPGSTNFPTPYKDEAMKKSVSMAANNAFLGGGLFMNMKREGKRFIELSDGKEVNPDWWEPGEPRDEYDCVGLSLQKDNTLKYKTMDCDFMATYLCAYNLTTL